MSEKLLFLHIPKAGGTTLHSIITRQYDKDEIYHIDGGNVSASLEEFRNKNDSEKEQVFCVKGHMPFGLHRELSAEFRYITMLRDPVKRTISHYHYVRQKKDHYLHDKVLSENITLEEYVNDGITHEIENGQTKLIAGNESNVGSRDLLEQAIKNIDDFFLGVGLLEQFDLSVLLFKKKLGWKNIFYKKKNITQSRPAASDYPESLLYDIKKKNEYDIQLYEYAEKLFWKNIFDNEITKYDCKVYDSLNFLYKNYLDSKKFLRSKFK